jgi:hypothetical protein
VSPVNRLCFHEEPQDRSPSSPFLYLSDSVTLLFRFQKTEKREESVTQMATIKRLLKDGASPKTFIDEYKNSANGNCLVLKSKDARSIFRESIRVASTTRQWALT